jgi:Ca-activated chloride channel homolog
VVALPHFFCPKNANYSELSPLNKNLSVTFAQPYWLSLLILLPLLYLWRSRSAQREMGSVLKLSSGALGIETWRSRLRRRLPWLRWAALVLLCLAMARPQRRWQEEKATADAIDIMLSMDISPSMLTKDFDPDRLAVAKRVASDFVDKRPHDRIGLVAFSAEAFTQCPLTSDKRVVKSFIQELTIGRLEDGTAIGMGLATAVNRLKDSPSKSRIVILLTDGENNAGYLQPQQAADLAAALDIRVYTVGIGTEGVALSPNARNSDGSYIFAPRQMYFDTELLRQMAISTKGKFYRAYSEADLTDIYEEIDRLEKTKVEVSTIKRSKDYFGWCIAAAVGLILLEIMLLWGFMRAVTVD